MTTREMAAELCRKRASSYWLDTLALFRHLRGTPEAIAFAFAAYRMIKPIGNGEGWAGEPWVWAEWVLTATSWAPGGSTLEAVKMVRSCFTAVATEADLLPVVS